MTVREYQIAAEISRLAREELRLEVDVELEEPLAERLDSLALLSLVTAVEDRFLVILTADDAAATRSLADLARLVARKESAPEAPAEAAP
jgi:acyl carrier protein